MDKKTYFISGHADTDLKDFTKFYIPLINKALEEDAYFVLGDCDGVDAMAQLYLKSRLTEDQQGRVKIFFKGEVPQNFMCDKFMPIGDFVSHEEAAVAMTLCSDEDIVCISPHKQASLTAQNVLRRYTPKFRFDKWATARKRHTKFWDAIYFEKYDTEVEVEEIPNEEILPENNQ